LLYFFEKEPQAGHLLITGSLAGGPRTLACRDEVAAKLASIVDEGASEGKSALAPPSLTGEGVVGGVLAVIQRRLAENSDTPLVELTNPLMSMIVLPYAGRATARRELKRPTPSPAARRTDSPSLLDPFKDAGMRLTYRTVRVLMAIAEYPGASNRLIAERAEIRDQGQISKLLARLERSGMVSNTGLGPGTGAPNAWTLTPSGGQVITSVRAHNADGADQAGAGR
jgi:DNA-binding MarR family transcriptional regulator